MTSSHPLWWEDVPARITRPRISGDLDADVAVVGAGFTGLWTARELLRRDPHLRVVILEAEHVGYGASGRNGGWASALFPVSLDVVSRDYSPEHALTFTRFLHRAVAELGAALDEDLIDADFVQGGTLTVARHEIQAERLRAEERDAHERGLSDDDLRWLPVDELESRVRLRGARGALYSPHCARLHPGKLVHGLARRVEELGAHIYEGSRVTRLLGATPNRRAQVLTTTGRVRADIVVRATEGYTPALGPRRTVVPIYSLMIATEPLDESWWSERGFNQAETFADARHLIIYGQRTADNRLAFGGRGAPYHFGSGVDPRFDHHSNVFASLRETLVDLVGDRGVEVSHQWGGPLAMPRDHYPRA
ncbi:MAG: FAD-dependent oxidoreductase, partial [Acidobacteria bacterium]|nr:FAD-dependent oxidoreductase [Acidobacteriota bacterium]